MKPVFKPVLVAGLLACFTVLSQAQPAAGPGPAAGGPGPNSDLRARLQEHRGQRIADIKAKLKLGPEQEGAWNSYIAAMKPPANIQRPNHADFDKLTTPERLDKLRALRRLREAEMDKREDATRAFYATLSAEQQKTFDASTARPFQNRGPRGPRKE